ncbi:hypothetical protein [Nostoc sp. DedQUE02]|nr:hypothetical protein [Nostoc sp. DedQUE03]MDZ7973434.1 hypothetical protein [Nostoc sp. DedQUE03]MDZ8045050.1 hypothetical protein [Nostoc sp. DedQUE02]
MSRQDTANSQGNAIRKWAIAHSPMTNEKRSPTLQIAIAIVASVSGTCIR